MSKPETKVVLGRRFARDDHARDIWRCETTHGLLSFWWAPGAKAYIAALAQNEDEPDMVRGEGPPKPTQSSPCSRRFARWQNWRWRDGDVH